jgi:hypothetical protein
MTFIDRVFDQMTTDGLNEQYSDTPEHPGIDQELRTIAKKIILLAQRVRRDHCKYPLSPTEILLVTYEIWHVDMLHRKRTRDKGGLVARKHLVGTTVKKIRDERLSNIYSIIAALHHDDAEDLPELHPKDPRSIGPKVHDKALLATEHYNFTPLHELNAFEGKKEITSLIDKTRGKVSGLVKGVSHWDDEDILKAMKLPKDTPKEEINAYKDATSIFILLSQAVKYGLRIVALKGADRADNMETIDVKARPRGEEITAQTAKIHVRVLRIFKFNHIANIILENCFRYRNPEAIQKCEKLREKHHQRFLGPGKNLDELRARLEPIINNPAVEYVRIRPRPLGEMLDPTQVDNLDYEPAAHPNDPLFEIYIQTKNPEECPNCKTSRKTQKLEAKLEKLKDKPASTRNQAQVRDLELQIYEEKRCTQLQTVLRQVEEFLDKDVGAGRGNPEKHRSSQEKGLEIDIYNEDLFNGKENALMTVRINDRRSENRTPRGWLHKEDEEFPEFLKEIVRDVLQRTRRRVKRLEIFDVLEKKLLRGFVRVYAPDGTEKIFLKGAVGIDYAASIHEQVLGKTLGIVVSVGAGKNAKAWQINPLDPLPDGAEIHVVTLDAEDQKFADYITQETPPDLRWPPFAGSVARKAARSLLHAPAPKKTASPQEKGKAQRLRLIRRIQGLAYMDHLAEIFNLGTREEVTRGILYGINQASHQKKVDSIKFSRNETATHLVKLKDPERQTKPSKALISRIEKELVSTELKYQKEQRANSHLVAEKIGQAQIEPLEVLFVKRLEASQIEEEDIIMEGINVEIDVPHEPGESEKISAIFGKWVINIEDMHTEQHPEDKSRKLIRATLKPKDDATLYDLARAILEINYRFENGGRYCPIRVTSDHLKQLCLEDRTAL